MQCRPDVLAISLGVGVLYPAYGLLLLNRVQGSATQPTRTASPRPC